MSTRAVALCLLTVVTGSVAAADSLLLPVFAHNSVGVDGARWSSELYLTNPSGQPVQVTLEQLLPGYVLAPAPCRSFVAVTRVVPPRSCVVWTAGGLAADLGCVEEALGSLILRVDGPLQLSSRMVRHVEAPRPASHIAGVGQEIAAVRLDHLPAAGAYLLPALIWHHGQGLRDGFTVAVGFANPGPAAVTARLDLSPEHPVRSLRLDGDPVDLPFDLEVPPGTWHQVRLSPTEDDAVEGPEGFSLVVTLDGPMAFYASVVDRSSHDPRTVMPVPLH